MSNNEPVIHLRDVTKRFAGGAPLLDNTTLIVPKGQLLAITGESGCGKSTLLNIIAGLEPIESGKVEVRTQQGIADVATLSEPACADLRKHAIGFVFQSFLLLPYLSVAKNIALTLSLNGVTGSAQSERVNALIDRLGLTDHAYKMPRQLSGGQMQRVAVARALAHRPAIVLADEPTGNLDGSSAHEVLKLFVQAVREEGCTCVLVTHSPQVANEADAVVRLADGKLHAVR